MDIETYMSPEYTHPGNGVPEATRNKLAKLPFTPVQVVRISDENKRIQPAYEGVITFLLAWCKENCTGRCDVVRGYWDYAFELEGDAIIFKLRWG